MLLPRRRALLRLLSGLVAGAASAGSTRSLAQDTPVPRRLPDAEIKGAFVFKFGEFVEWPHRAPTAPETPFRIAVLGSHPMAAVLEELSRQRKVNGRPVVISRVPDDDPLPPANIIVIDSAQAARLPALATQLRDACVLSVTDNDEASAPAGIINFVVRDNKVRFEIDADAAEDAGLKISSKVMSLAVAVKRRGGR